MHGWNNPILRFAERTPAGVLALALALGAVGGWLFSNDAAAVDVEQRLRAERTRLELRLAEAQRRIEQLEVDVTPAQERVMASEKVIKELRQLTSTWQWFGGNREQQVANVKRLTDMEALHADALTTAAALQQELRQAKWEREGHEIELGRIEAQLRDEESRKQGTAYRVRWAWLRVRSWILLTGAAYVLVGGFLPAARRRWRMRRAAAA